MSLKTCFVSIDVEHDKREQGSYRGVEQMDKILTIFRKYNIPATFFVTGQVLEKYRSLAETWAHNFEIACHTFSHTYWNALDVGQREKELADFISLYKTIFSASPKGFRAPSHIIDNEAMKLLEQKGFLYDSSVVPHYPPFKKYRGYQGRRPLNPHYLSGSRLFEIPLQGQVFGIPLAGAWFSKMPFWFYRILFEVYSPKFLTLSLHSWDSLDEKCLNTLDKVLNLLKSKNYNFKNGAEILQNY